ncbi:MAG TPA: hypothetical protein VGE51_12375 [Fontimonas sp.]
MAEPPDPSAVARQQLLATGRRLAATHRRRAELTRAVVCAQAGVTPEAFAALYGSDEAFHCDLLAALLDDLRDTVTRATAGMPPGIPRLKMAVETYLEAQARQPTLCELRDSLHVCSDGAQALARHRSGFGMMVALELKASDWPEHQAAGPLLAAAIAEVARAERQDTQPMPGLRETLYRYLDHLPP